MSADIVLQASHDPARESTARDRAAVLVVDDNASKRLGVQAMLKPLDLQIVEAESGRAALRAVSSQSFAVILMDVRMPNLDGYETAKLIRERREAGLTPIIFFTAFGLGETETLTAYANGAVDFIFTPVLADVLRAKVTSFVNLFVQAEELKESLDSIMALNVALRDSEVRSKAVLHNVADGIVTADGEGAIESFNRAAETLFGYTEDELVGEPLDRIIVAPEGTSDEAVRTAGRRKDGSSFPLEMRASEMRVGDRTLSIGCLHDITAREERAEHDRVHAQQANREAQRDRAAFDEAPIGSIIVSRPGRILRVNQAVCTMLGTAADDLVGTLLTDQLILPDDHDGSAPLVAGLTGDHSATQRYERHYQLRNGRALDCRIAVTAIRDEADEVTQFYAQIEDVTEARRIARDLEHAQAEMLARLAAAAEFRDDDTGQHTRRVGDLSVAIAECLGLPKMSLELIRLAAPLHDVGKISIPDAVLSKPGRLTAEEFDQIKTHTTVGAQMLSGSAFPLLDFAREIALNHHEKWDGSGYPNGLAGDAIPITGRIVAVADVFDALTHERPYKKAWTVDDALAEMQSQAGRHFDPQALDAFLSLSLDGDGPPAGLVANGAVGDHG